MVTASDRAQLAVLVDRTDSLTSAAERDALVRQPQVLVLEWAGRLVGLVRVGLGASEPDMLIVGPTYPAVRNTSARLAISVRVLSQTCGVGADGLAPFLGAAPEQYR